jgi:hypothetical protein
VNGKPDRVGITLAIAAVILIFGVPIVVGLLTSSPFSTPEDIASQITTGPEITGLSPLVVVALTDTALASTSLPSFVPTPTAIVVVLTTFPEGGTLAAAIDRALTGTAVRQQTQVARQSSTAISTPMPPTVAPCYFNWATQDLPELTAEVQAAMDAAGLENVSVSAYAYGENCYAYDTNEVVYFATMETDFDVTAQVDDLEDSEALGDQTADILAVLNEFPPGETPGPMPGQITITYVKDSEQVVLPVSAEVAAQVVEQGIRGGGLWVVLNEIR